MPVPIEAFDTWLLHRVAHVVEAGEMSANLLTKLQAEFAEARERPSNERHALAIQELADQFGLSVERHTELLAALETQPTVTREIFLREVAEAWLAQQRAEYETRHHGD
jgi:hypothetical protein